MLFLINRAFWGSGGAYPGDRIYGSDDGPLCLAALESGRFVGWTSRVTCLHLSADATESYQQWKREHVSGPDAPGFWG